MQARAQLAIVGTLRKMGLIEVAQHEGFKFPQGDVARWRLQVGDGLVSGHEADSLMLGGEKAAIPDLAPA
jgi:hypothetical protein